MSLARSDRFDFPSPTALHIPLQFLLLIALMLPLSASAQQTDQTLLEFEMEDQSGKLHRDENHAGSLLIVIASDKAGSDFNKLWGKAIDDSLKSHPEYRSEAQLGVADMRGVPSFLRGFIRSRFPKHPPILMDWEGVFAKAYAMKPNVSNILIFDSGGELGMSVTGTEVTHDKLRAILEKAREVLDKQP